MLYSTWSSKEAANDQLYHPKFIDIKHLLNLLAGRFFAETLLIL
jgi:hypothetical protein